MLHYIHQLSLPITYLSSTISLLSMPLSNIISIKSFAQLAPIIYMYIYHLLINLCSITYVPLLYYSLSKKKWSRKLALLWCFISIFTGFLLALGMGTILTVGNRFLIVFMYIFWTKWKIWCWSIWWSSEMRDSSWKDWKAVCPHIPSGIISDLQYLVFDNSNSPTFLSSQHILILFIWN